MVLISRGNHAQLKFKPGSVARNDSTIGPPAGIEPIPKRSAGLIPAGGLGPIVDSFFPVVPSLSLSCV